MARPQQDGLLYFSLDTDFFFADKRICSLRVRYGADGVLFYIYILTEVYRNGYYLKWDNDAIEGAMVTLNFKEGLIKQVVAFLVGRSLLVQRTLANSDTVLTSPGIQKRYQEAAKTFRRDVIVDSEIWLLEKEETATFIKFTQKSANNEKSANNYGKNGNKYSKNDTKKKKEKEIKENKREREGEEPVSDETEPVPPRSQCNVIKKQIYGEYNNVLLTDEEFQKLQTEFLDYQSRIDRLSSYMASSGKTYDNHYATIRSWAKEDAGRGRKEQTLPPANAVTKSAMAYTNYSQRQYSQEEWDDMEMKLLAVAVQQ